tara:strand:+ start:1787 stop:2704 length:918 start_codon:yes stop_codon:yes gene_type:complete
MDLNLQVYNPVLDSLQRQKDIKKLPKLPSQKWPDFVMSTQDLKTDEVEDIKKIKKYHRSEKIGYDQAQPYAPILSMSGDMKIDELAHQNKYMKIAFGGIPGPLDNIDLAYNNALRQMSEAKTYKDSLIGNQNPLDVVENQQATKESLLETFAETRRFYKGAVDTDAERAMKTRPTHRMIATTFYGKDITKGGLEAGRFHTVRGQFGDLQYRPTHLQDFKPIQNLSSKTYAPNGLGGEVPLNYSNTNGVDPRTITLTDEPRVPPSFNPNAVDLTNYSGSAVDAQLFDFASENPTLTQLFHQFKPRQ